MPNNLSRKTKLQKECEDLDHKAQKLGVVLEKLNEELNSFKAQSDNEEKKKRISKKEKEIASISLKQTEIQASKAKAEHEIETMSSGAPGFSAKTPKGPEENTQSAQQHQTSRTTQPMPAGKGSSPQAQQSVSVSSMMNPQQREGMGGPSGAANANTAGNPQRGQSNMPTQSQSMSGQAMPPNVTGNHVVQTGPANLQSPSPQPQNAQLQSAQPQGQQSPYQNSQPQGQQSPYQNAQPQGQQSPFQNSQPQGQQSPYQSASAQRGLPPGNLQGSYQQGQSPLPSINQGFPGMGFNGTPQQNQMHSGFAPFQQMNGQSYLQGGGGQAPNMGYQVPQIIEPFQGNNVPVNSVEGQVNGIKPEPMDQTGVHLDDEEDLMGEQDLHGGADRLPEGKPVAWEKGRGGHKFLVQHGPKNSAAYRVASRNECGDPDVADLVYLRDQRVCDEVDDKTKNYLVTGKHVLSIQGIAYRPWSEEDPTQCLDPINHGPGRRWEECHVKLKVQYKGTVLAVWETRTTLRRLLGNKDGYTDKKILEAAITQEMKYQKYAEGSRPASDRSPSPLANLQAAQAAVRSSTPNVRGRSSSPVIQAQLQLPQMGQTVPTVTPMGFAGGSNQPQLSQQLGNMAPQQLQQLMSMIQALQVQNPQSQTQYQPQPQSQGGLFHSQPQQQPQFPFQNLQQFQPAVAVR